MAEKTLYWLVFAIELPRASHIACAISLGLAETDERSVRPIDGAKLAQCCQGLLDFHPATDTLQFVHSSAKEFFCQKLNGNMAHSYLGKICLLALTTLEHHPDQPPLNITYSSSITGEEGLFAYARKHYLRHCVQAVSTDQRIGPFIDADDLGFLGKAAAL